MFLSSLSLILFFFLLHVKRFLQCFTDPLAKEEESVGIDITQPLYMQRLGEVINSDLQMEVLYFEIIKLVKYDFFICLTD